MTNDKVIKLIPRRFCESNKSDSYDYAYDIIFSDKTSKKEKMNAVDEMQRLADLEYPSAMYIIGYLYFNGEVVKRDNKKAFQMLKKLAEIDDFYICTELGMLYDGTSGIMRDDAKALHYYEVCANRGETAAMLLLGRKYYDQYMLYKKDAYRTLAEKWFKAAEETSPEDVQIPHYIAFYYAGTKLSENDAIVIKYLEKSANLGDMGDLYEVARCYYKGDHTEKNLDKARMYYKRFIDLGGIEGEDIPLERARKRYKMLSNPILAFFCRIF